MIPNIVKGKGISGALAYSMGQGNDPTTQERLTLKPGEQSRAALLGGQNFGFEVDSDARLELARRMMEWQGMPQNQAGKTRKLDRDCFHASLSWGDGQTPTASEMLEAGQQFLKAVGLEKARAVFVAHNDTDHAHIHIVASRIDPETGRTLNSDNDWTKGQAWAKQWEREHGQERSNDKHAGIIEAVQNRDAAAVLAYLTRDKSTFQTWEVNRVLQYGGMTIEREKEVSWMDAEGGLSALSEKQQKKATKSFDSWAKEKPELAATYGFADYVSYVQERHAKDKQPDPLAASRREAAEFRAAILTSSNVIGLSDAKGEEVSRYTTVEALAPEMALMSDAAQLEKQTHHATRAATVEKAAADYTLWPEQAKALHQLTEAKGLGILWGEAGTGKSHTLKATRAVYEAEGKTVIGLAWTNDVAQQMRGDGFKNANTIASEFIALDKGRTSWNRDTVLVVDEAAMISTENLGKLASAARRAGAKLILAGDDAQLASIERGGTFETLRQKHGAAILSDVQRVSSPEEQAAWGKMHGGDFRPALEIADKAGNIHWSTRQSDTLKNMAARYTDDLASAPDKKRFMFAYTNADVATLNAHARDLHKARGDLGEDHALKTATGEQQFAEGDRIQFTGNGRTQAEKKAGLVNGRVGTIAALEIAEGGTARVTVDLDARSGEKPQQVSFIVGEDAKAGEFDKFKHGYAGTIYRGQGRTLDEVYVAHTDQWRKSASYVALTRHREAVHIFASRETVKDLDAMAAGMARADNKRAASAYYFDEVSAARAGLGKAVEAYSESRAAPPQAASKTATQGQTTGQTPATGAGRSLNELGNTAADVVGGAGRVLDSVADLAASAIETLADFLGGGSASPSEATTEQSAMPDPKPATPEEAAQREEAQRSTHRQELLRDYGREVPPEIERDVEIERDQSRQRER